MACSLARFHTRRVTIDPQPDKEEAGAERVYSLCSYARDTMAAEVQFVEAANDQDASALAASIRPWTRRELWDRHRLVRVLPAAGVRTG